MDFFFFVLGAGLGVHFKEIEEYRTNKKNCIFALILMISICLYQTIMIVLLT